MNLIFEIIPTCHTENIDQCVNKSINKSELVRVVPPKQKRYNKEFYSNNFFLPFIHRSSTNPDTEINLMVIQELLSKHTVL